MLEKQEIQGNKTEGNLLGIGISNASSREQDHSSSKNFVVATTLQLYEVMQQGGA